MLRSLSLRWKILLALLGLSLLSLIILVTLFTSIGDLKQREKKEQLITLNGTFAAQSLADLEQLLRAQLQPMSYNSNLISAMELVQQQESTSPLEQLLQKLSARYDLDRMEVIFPNGSVYLLDRSSNSQELQRLQLSKEQAESLTLSAPPSSGLYLDRARPGIEVSLPIMQQKESRGRLVVMRNINNQLATQLQTQIGTNLAFHDGKNVIASSLPEIKQLSLPSIIGRNRSITLNDTPYSIHPFTFETGGDSGLLLIINESRDKMLEAAFHKDLTFAALAVLLLAIVAAMILSRNISRPLQYVVNSLQEIADGEGSLTSALEISPENEIGKLSSGLNRLMSRLHEVVFRTRTAALSLSQAIEKMRTHSTDVNSGAREQASSMEDAHQAITDIGKAAEAIAESVSNLVASVQESAAATHQFGSTTLSISQQMESLVGVVNEISTSIQQLSDSNEQIDQSIKELYGGAQNTGQATKLLEQATAVIEEGAKLTSQHALEAAAQALDGKAAVQDTIRGISGLQQLIEQAHKAILNLGARSDAIGNIVNVIADVADQTNLLALNAAIIAAQAGDHGHGFAVVADEIRNLAERTTTSAGEITEIINNLQSGTRTAVEAIEAGSERAKQEVAHSHAAGNILERLHEGALKSTEQVQSIVDQTHKQSEESRKISQEASSITDMLEQVASSMGMQTESTRQMADSAKSMTSIAAKVKMSTDEQNRGGQQIAQSIEHIQQMIEQIDASTQNQNLRSKEAVGAVSSARKIAEITAARSVEMNAVVESLDGQVRNLQQDVLEQGPRPEPD
ncbi:MAG TPA: HAMP domain-containing methyl-accepting chemotaxis protein [Geopsychrobacteraceae bacterium]|nr:HAMP domain-containing methyl-accepting chemotaxis protein [Geopsychrobacteraceae bacterium]